MGSKQWAVNNGQLIIEVKVNSRQCTLGSEQWIVGRGQQAVKSGQAVDSGY